MSCYNEGELQAYLDGAVSFKERNEIQNHIGSCNICRVNLCKLKEDKDFISDSLGLWGEEVTQLKIPVKYGWSKFNLHSAHRLDTIPPQKGVFTLSTRLKRWSIAAATFLLLGLSFTSSTVRAAASDFLTIFRVEKVQTVSINPQQLSDIEKVFREKGISLKLDNFGKLTNDGVEPPQEMSLAAAEKLADFSIRTPEYLPYKYNQVKTSFSKAGTVEFQLNVQNVNKLIKSLGGSTLLPAQLDNQTFYLKVPGSMFMNYSVTDQQGRITHRLSISQFKTPEIIGPSDVDADQIREAMLALPVIPDDIRKQLASIQDWQKTLVIPTVKGETSEINIAGNKGFYTVPRAGRQWSEYGLLTWESNGVITIIEGDLSRNDLVKVAENLQ